MDPRPTEPPLDRDAFARHVIALLEKAGVTQPIAHDEDAGKLRFGESVFDLSQAYTTYVSLPPHQRDAVLGRLVRLGANPPRPPATWAEAKDRVLPLVQPRITAVVSDGRREPGNPILRADLTEHTVVEVAISVPDGSLSLDEKTVRGWGVSPDDVAEQAAHNLAARGARAWSVTKEYPGVYRSPWRDGFDVSRLLFPEVFSRLGEPLRGDPVAIAPSTGTLLVAGADDEQGLFHLGRLGRRVLEQDGVFHVYRPLRRTGTGWTHWLPPPGHPARQTLGLLQALSDRSDYEAQARLIRSRAVEQKRDTVALPPIDVHQALGTGEPLTVVTWRQGRPAALPRVDGVVLVRGKETLGLALWDDFLRVLGGDIQTQGGYLPRWLAREFPEPWQLSMLELRPWGNSQSSGS